MNIKEDVICIKGSSVNESRFTKESKKSTPPSHEKELGLVERGNTLFFLFVSRLLKEKGVLELIEGFKKASDISNKKIHLILVGWSDPDNPSSVKVKELNEHIGNREDISYLGWRSDIDYLISESDVSILPTYYREGVPRFLLESMAMAKPIITTKMPGCMDLIHDNANGELINPKDTDAITRAILNIIDRDLGKMGEVSWELYHSKYSEKKVYTSILDLYNKILN